MMSGTVIYLISYALLLAAGLLILRFVVRGAYRQYGRLTRSAAALQALIFFAFGGFPSLYLSKDWPAVHVPTMQHWLGAILPLFGLVLLFQGMLRLGVLRSLGRGTLELQQTGLYRLTRNPQALSCGLYVLGFALLWPSGYAFGWLLLYIVLIHTMVLTEEEHLRRTYGEKYEAYCRQVPRYLGPLGRSRAASAKK